LSDRLGEVLWLRAEMCLWKLVLGYFAENCCAQLLFLMRVACNLLCSYSTGGPGCESNGGCLLGVCHGLLRRCFRFNWLLWLSCGIARGLHFRRLNFDGLWNFNRCRSLASSIGNIKVLLFLMLRHDPGFHFDRHCCGL